MFILTLLTQLKKVVETLKSNDPAIFSGLFWTGEQAIQLGVADRSGNITSLMRELKLDNKVDYTIERNPLQSILGRMGSEMGKV
jgi:protease-4